VTVVPEDRPAYLLCDVNVEALELVGGWIQIAEQQRVLRAPTTSLPRSNTVFMNEPAGKFPGAGIEPCGRRLPLPLSKQVGTEVVVAAGLDLRLAEGDDSGEAGVDG